MVISNPVAVFRAADVALCVEAVLCGLVSLPFVMWCARVSLHISLPYFDSFQKELADIN